MVGTFKFKTSIELDEEYKEKILKFIEDPNGSYSFTFTKYLGVTETVVLRRWDKNKILVLPEIKEEDTTNTEIPNQERT